MSKFHQTSLLPVFLIVVGCMSLMQVDLLYAQDPPTNSPGQDGLGMLDNMDSEDAGTEASPQTYGGNPVNPATGGPMINQPLGDPETSIGGLTFRPDGKPNEQREINAPLGGADQGEATEQTHPIDNIPLDDPFWTEHFTPAEIAEMDADAEAWNAARAAEADNIFQQELDAMISDEFGGEPAEEDPEPQPPGESYQGNPTHPGPRGMPYVPQPLGGDDPFGDNAQNPTGTSQDADTTGIRQDGEGRPEQHRYND